MVLKWIWTGLAAALVLGQPGMAAADFAGDFREALYSGRTGTAAELAEVEIAANPDDGTAQAALGVAQFLGTVEGLIQGFYRHGLNNGANGYGPAAMAGLPFLRLPVPDNPAPEPVSYEALRTILRDFANGLAEAEATLAATGERSVALELNLSRIQLDLNGDGASGPGEGLMNIFGAVAGPVAPGAEGSGLIVDFDGADAVWLQAYSHILMAMTDFLLAHDWSDAYAATMEGMFPASFTPRTALYDRAREAMARLPELEAKAPPMPDCQLWGDDGQKVETCEQAYRDYRMNETVREIESLKAALEYSSIADLIAFVHLLRWPVAEPDRAAAALGHLESMVTLSRENWRRILAETDDGREWLPGPGQTGVFRTLTIDQARLDGWLGFLDQFERVLKGESLLPHWRFKQGFNLRRMFLEPTTFDVVMLAQGHAILPYLEDGPIADAATWERATEVFGGDFFSYFLWIN